MREELQKGMSYKAVKALAFGYLSSWVVLKAVEDTGLLQAQVRLFSPGFPTFALLQNEFLCKREWVFRGEWLHDYQRNT